jgi:hypothetical protein
MQASASVTFYTNSLGLDLGSGVFIYTIEGHNYEILWDIERRLREAVESNHDIPGEMLVKHCSTDQFEIISKFLDAVEGTNMVPDVHLFEKVCDVVLQANESFTIYVLVNERCDTDINKKYDLDLQGPGPISVDVLNSDALFEEFFPSDKVPVHIRSQVKDLLERMHSLGYSQEDCHAGNFVLKGDHVMMIDYDCIALIDM